MVQPGLEALGGFRETSRKPPGQGPAACQTIRMGQHGLHEHCPWGEGGARLDLGCLAPIDGAIWPGSIWRGVPGNFPEIARHRVPRIENGASANQGRALHGHGGVGKGAKAGGRQNKQWRVLSRKFPRMF